VGQRDRAAVLGLVIVAAIAVAVLAPVLAPADPLGYCGGWLDASRSRRDLQGCVDSDA